MLDSGWNDMTEPTPDVLWAPDPERAAAAPARGVRSLSGHGRAGWDDYAALHSWSVSPTCRDFWGAAAEFLGVRFHDRPRAVLGRRDDAGRAWFPGATLNYAEHALRAGDRARPTTTSR